MQFSRCKCGHRKRWHSGYPAVPCQVCEKCGSTLSTHPDSHKEPAAHNWVQRYSEQTGLPHDQVCEQCHEMKALAS